MITKIDATNIVNKELYKIGSSEDEKLVIFEIIEKDTYWIFKYDSAKFLASGNFNDLLVGVCPIIVTKENGEMIYTGTANILNYYLNLFEKGEKW